MTKNTAGNVNRNFQSLIIHNQYIAVGLSEVKSIVSEETQGLTLGHRNTIFRTSKDIHTLIQRKYIVEGDHPVEVTWCFPVFTVKGNMTFDKISFTIDNHK